MATKSQLKKYFETGKIPTQAQFGELIDYIAPTHCETPTVLANSIPGPGTFVLYNTNNRKLALIKYYITIIDSKLVLYKYERFTQLTLTDPMIYEIGIIKSLNDDLINKLTINPRYIFMDLESLIGTDSFTIKTQ